MDAIVLVAGQRGAVRGSVRVPLFRHAVAGGDTNVGWRRDGERVRVQARLRCNLSDEDSIRVNGVGRDGAAAVKPVQPRNRDGVSIAAAHVNDGRVGRGRRDARFGLAVVQVKMHARRELEPAQALRLVRNDALRLLLVVRPAGNNLASNHVVHFNAGINAHVFEVVARVARALVVKHAVLRIHHNVGGVETGRGRGTDHQLVRIRVLGGEGGRVHRGKAQHRDGDVGVIGDREVAVIHVPGAGLEGGPQIAGRRRRQQVLALGHVQQVGVAGCARERGGRGLHGSHVFGAVRFCQCAAVFR